MATKKDLLNNLLEFTTDQVAQAVNDGVVSMYELSKSGNLTPLMRRRIEERLAAGFNQKAEVQTSSLEQVPALSPVAVHQSTISRAENVNVPEPKENVTIPEPKLSIPEAKIPENISISEAPVATVVGSQSSVLSYNATESSSSTYNGGKTNKGMFKRPFSFSGRIRRLEYGLSFLLYYAWYIILTVAGESNNMTQDMAIFILISVIPMIWFLWAQGAKRCHDRGNSGWYQLIPFYFFVLIFGSGDEGDNEYGDCPK